MRLGIVGHRDFHDVDFIMDQLLSTWGFDILDYDTIVSGGAPGVDTCAEAIAVRLGYAPIIHRADWDYLDAPDARIRTRADGTKYNAAAGPNRNKLIVRDSDYIFAFKAAGSKGTQSTINIANRQGVFVHVVNIPGGKTVSMSDHPEWPL